MSDALTPERIAYGRKLLARLGGYVGSRLVEKNGSWHEVLYEELEPHETYEADIKEWLFANRNALLDAADEAARLRWYKDHAQKLAGEMTRRCEQVEKLREALAGLRAQVNYDLYDQLPFAAWKAAIRAADDALITTAPKEQSP